MSYQKVKIGEFLKRVKRSVQIDDIITYKRITISSNHNGIKQRDVLIGAEIGTKNQFVVKNKDFILSKIDARNGAFGVIDNSLSDSIITGNFWAYIVDNNIVSSKWFLYFTNSDEFISICEKASAGTTHRKYLKEQTLLSYELLVPSISEQENIILEIAISEKKSNIIRKEIILQKEYVAKLKQSILQDAISGKLTEEWRTNNPNTEPASELLKRIKKEKQQLIKDGKIRKEKPLAPIVEDEIPFEIPSTWQWCRLSDLCSKTGSGSTPKGGKSAYPTSGIHFLRSQNVHNNGITLDGIVYISESTHKTMSGTMVRPNDILLNITGGSIGRCAIVANEIETANINQHVAIIRLMNNEMNIYIHSIVISDYFQQMIESVQTGAGREGLPKNKMDNILIPIPPIEEIQHIESLINSKMTLCKDIEDQIKLMSMSASKLSKTILTEILKTK